MPGSQAVPGRWMGEPQSRRTHTRTPHTSTPTPPATGPTPPPTPNPADRERLLRDRLRAELGPERFSRYFEQGARLSVTEECIEVVVPSPFMAERFSRQLLATVRRAAAAQGEAPVEVRVRIDRSLEHQPEARAPIPERAIPRPTPERTRRPKLTLRHRLDEFIVGESNRLAHTAASRIAEGVDDAIFSPLFLHGPSGVGKTHLLQGVARRYLERCPGSRIRYVTAEAFTNEYITAIRSNATDTFRRSLRGVKLLCLDDVHFLRGKKSTQNELLHTLDAIALTEARIVLASDEHPRRIGEFSEHLVSRFLSGAIVRIEEPDEVLCGRLVRALAVRRELPLTADGLAVLTHRAANAASGGQGRSVREIEGLLNQVEAVRRLTPDLCGGLGPMDASAVRRALGLSEGAAMHRGANRKPVRLETILREACAQLRVEAEDLFGKGRHKRVVLARGLIVRLARELTTLSYPEIARGLRRPNHSTVITANQRIGRQMEADTLADCGPDLAGLTIADLLARIRGRVLEQTGR
ncbi:Chromosomal replication initiator protein DnaA [hydrothermal vent metagenome]|uniref:Chromosomal replication initiator protein DnaA n=1 Tax=hydrothermal vent metagenome TaxID=652676 RepID=A0A3B1DNF9_9ZZZZ